MIKIKVFKNKDGHITKYTIKGHAGYDEYGKDIVCSAISVLGQTGINALEAVCDIVVQYKDGDGYLEVIMPENIDIEKRKKADIVLNTILVGMNGVLEVYPDYVTLEYGEV